MHPQPLDGGGDGSSGFWFPMNMNKDQFEPQSQIEQNPNPLKRHRISEEYQSMNANATHPQNGPGSNNNNNNPKGTGNIFFKTRFCAKFKHGMCRNGESCNFAHGDADLRQPPPNWQEIVAGGGRVEDRANPLGDDDQKIIHRLKLCKKFYKGEECPYGDRCNFIHKDPARLSDDPGRLRESSAISIGITATALEVPMVNGSVSSLSAYWKTKLCTKFETTGQCPFGGTCHFAHGVAELQVPEAEAGNAGGSVVGRSQPVLCASPCVSASVPMINDEGHGKRRLLNINGSKKINGIYGDWLDDFF